MAEAELSDKTTLHKKQYQQNRPVSDRPTYTNRGRGRFDPHVSKALHNFGVSDLRELLDRKHQEQRQSKNGPPPDPSYSYLKDPLRENANYDDQNRKHQKDHPERVSGSSSRGRAHWRSRGRGGVNKGDRSHQFEKTSFIENPVNIKIALSTATGERSCVLDEETKLTGIKHIFERRPQEGRSFEGEDGGGGEKGKGGRRRYENSGREKAGGERREDRGRGGRGMGSGRRQRKYNPNTSNRSNYPYSGNNPGHNKQVTEVPTDENWDIECVNHPNSPLNKNFAQHENFLKKNEEGTGENLDKACLQNSEEYEEHERYCEDDNECVEEIEESHLRVETEVNLVITSLVPQNNEENRKRAVRFELADEVYDTKAQLVKSADGKEIESEEKAKHEEEKEQTNGKEVKANEKLQVSGCDLKEEKQTENKADEKTKVHEKFKTEEASIIESIRKNEGSQITETESEVSGKLKHKDALKSAIKEKIREQADEKENKNEEKLKQTDTSKSETKEGDKI